MSEMVERVGKAMADSVAMNYDHNQAIFDRYARAAIEAMRKPTDEMIGGAWGGTDEVYKDHADMFRVAWQAMIDEALR